MKELIDQLKKFLGTRVENVREKDVAEIEIVIGEMENVTHLSEEVRLHILDVIDGNTVAKIDFVTSEGKELYSFSLNQ